MVRGARARRHAVGRGVLALSRTPTVLVLRALGLGDLLTAVPALRGVGRAFPGHRLRLATDPALRPLVDLVDVVDELLPARGLEPLAYDGAPPDVAVNLHGKGPQSHRVLGALAPERLVAFGCGETGVEGPVWRRDEHEVARWCRLLNESLGPVADPGDLRLCVPAPASRPAPASARESTSMSAPATVPETASRPAPASVRESAAPAPVPPSVSRPAPATVRETASRPSPATVPESAPEVVVHPGAAQAARRWPPERFAAVAAALVEQGQRVWLTGSAGERDLAEKVAVEAGLGASCVLAGDTSLADLAVLVDRAALVVCGDTGTSHLATAFGTPSVVLFGPTPPAWWGPPETGRHVALWHGTRAGDPWADAPDPALLRITVAEVLAEARRLLRRP